MANSAAGEPDNSRNFEFQCVKTSRTQISASCDNSRVVSSSAAEFANSRNAIRVISRFFQWRSARKLSAPMSSSTRRSRATAISARLRPRVQISGSESQSRTDGVRKIRAAQVLERAKRRSSASSPNGKFSIVACNSIASRGHAVFSWISVVSTWVG